MKEMIRETYVINVDPKIFKGMGTPTKYAKDVLAKSNAKLMSIEELKAKQSKVAKSKN